LLDWNWNRKNRRFRFELLRFLHFDPEIPMPDNPETVKRLRGLRRPVLRR
jgi:hypothetical protein